MVRSGCRRTGRDDRVLAGLGEDIDGTRESDAFDLAATKASFDA